MNATRKIIKVLILAAFFAIALNFSVAIKPSVQADKAPSTQQTTPQISIKMTSASAYKYGDNTSVTNVLTRKDPSGSWMFRLYDIFKGFTNIFLFIGLLVFAFANILHINIDTYAIKKLLPKLIAVVLMINLALPIIAIFSTLVDKIQTISIFNSYKGIIGHSLPFYSQISAVWENFSWWDGIKLGLSTIVAIIPMLVILLLSVFVQAGVTLMLALRPFIVYLATAVAPLAIACALLPQTETFFKRWLKVIAFWLVYPLIVSVFAYIISVLPGFTYSQGFLGATLAVSIPLIIKIGFLTFLLRMPFTWEKDVGGLIAKIPQAGKQIAGTVTNAIPAIVGTQYWATEAAKKVNSPELERRGRLGALYDVARRGADLNATPEERAAALQERHEARERLVNIRAEQIAPGIAAQLLKDHPNMPEEFAKAQANREAQRQAQGELRSHFNPRNPLNQNSKNALVEDLNPLSARKNWWQKATQIGVPYAMGSLLYNNSGDEVGQKSKRGKMFTRVMATAEAARTYLAKSAVNTAIQAGKTSEKEAYSLVVPLAAGAERGKGRITEDLKFAKTYAAVMDADPETFKAMFEGFARVEGISDPYVGKGLREFLAWIRRKSSENSTPGDFYDMHFDLIKELALASGNIPSSQVRYARGMGEKLIQIAASTSILGEEEMFRGAEDKLAELHGKPQPYGGGPYRGRRARPGSAPPSGPGTPPPSGPPPVPGGAPSGNPSPGETTVDMSPVTQAMEEMKDAMSNYAESNRSIADAVKRGSELTRNNSNMEGLIQHLDFGNRKLITELKKQGNANLANNTSNVSPLETEIMLERMSEAVKK